MRAAAWWGGAAATPLQLFCFSSCNVAVFLAVSLYFAFRLG
jgi:hypothetical protein